MCALMMRRSLQCSALTLSALTPLLQPRSAARASVGPLKQLEETDMPMVDGKKYPYTAAGKKAAKTAKVMSEYKAGTLNSGKGGPVVKSRKQAVAIALSEASRMGKKKK
jgi:hypothetical protein